MPTYAHIATYDAPVEQVWSWYDSPGAFRRIMPEWEGIRPLEAGRLVDDATTRWRCRGRRGRRGCRRAVRVLPPLAL